MTNEERIQKATELMEQADKLREDANDLIDPIAKAAAATKDIAEIRRVANLLPRGFFSSELRTMANMIESGKELN